MRFPVRVNSALHTAGSTGGNAGSPSPVGELSVLRKWTSISGGACVKRTGGDLLEILLTPQPRSMRSVSATRIGSASTPQPFTLVLAAVPITYLFLTVPA